MATPSKRNRTRRQPVDGERLAIVETRLEETLNALPAAIKAAVTEGMADIAARVAALEAASRASVAVSAVQQVHRSELQEWARTLTPYVFALASAVVGWRAFG